MEFEKEVTLFLDLDEYDKVKDLLKEKTIILESRCDEGVSVCLNRDEIDFKFIFELEDLLDETITLCNRYFGSTSCIRANGLC